MEYQIVSVIIQLTYAQCYLATFDDVSEESEVIHQAVCQTRFVQEANTSTFSYVATQQCHCQNYLISGILIKITMWNSEI